jgi:hypothetical protein
MPRLPPSSPIRTILPSPLISRQQSKTTTWPECPGNHQPPGYEKFTSDLRTSPFHFPGHPDLLLPTVNRLLKAWQKVDPPPSLAAAITPKHLRFIHLYGLQSKSIIIQTISELISGAFFFACRTSCEYLVVPVRGRTTLLTVGDISFSTKTCQPITILTQETLRKAHFVSLTFREQKNRDKNVTRTQQRNYDPLLCPVAIWAKIVLRILQSPNTSMSTPVCHLFDPSDSIGRQSKQISQAAVNHILRLTCKLKPALYFGYRAADIGTHSIRAGAAMALFMANEHPHKIMLLGRWSSDAFLAYIRPQVQEWTSGMSANMLQNESFHLPNPPDPQHNNNKRHPSDPLI